MKNNETGRSMVEMLGVLAIIGVLSVGGIAGYTMAMNKYKANEILNTASQAVILAKAYAGGTGLATDASKTAADLGLLAPAGIKAASDIKVTNKSTGYEVDLTNVDNANVCSAITSAAPSDATVYKVNSCSTGAAVQQPVGD